MFKSKLIKNKDVQMNILFNVIALLLLFVMFQSGVLVISH